MRNHVPFLSNQVIFEGIVVNYCLNYLQIAFYG